MHPTDERCELTVVVPVFRSAETITVLTERLHAVLVKECNNFELILVEDAGGDGTWDVVCKLAKKYPDSVTAVQLARNVGQHNALMCGLRHAQGEWIITLDDDLQNPPEEIPVLLDAGKKLGLELIYARYDTKEHASWRNLGSAVVNGFYRAVFRNKITVTSFRAMRKELVQSVLTYNLNYTYLDGLLAWNTSRIGSVPIKHDERQSGRSGYSLKKLVILALNLYTNFSLLPLQVISMLGAIVAIGGIILAAYFLFGALTGYVTVPGFASIIVAILTLGGLQMLSLGIIGEYLGRVHLNINRKPQYRELSVIKKVKGQ